jgi:hypothetical protein
LLPDFTGALCDFLMRRRIGFHSQRGFFPARQSCAGVIYNGPTW